MPSRAQVGSDASRTGRRARGNPLWPISRDQPGVGMVLWLLVLVAFAVSAHFLLAPATRVVLRAVLPEHLGIQFVAGASWLFTALALVTRSPRVRPGRRLWVRVVGVAMLLVAWLCVPVGGGVRGGHPEGAGDSAPGFALGLLVTLPLSGLGYWLATRRPEREALFASIVREDARLHGRWDTKTREHVLPTDWDGAEGTSSGPDYTAALQRYRAGLRSEMRFALAEQRDERERRALDAPRPRARRRR